MSAQVDRIGEALRARGWTLAVAESCTGGMIGARVTAVSGSSDYFVGGVIAYADATKVALLGVDEAEMAREGAVSDEVARQMAAGVRTRLDADIALSVTGVAGPRGGTPGKPGKMAKYLFLHSATKMYTCRIITQITQWQHCNRLL